MGVRELTLRTQWTPLRVGPTGAAARARDHNEAGRTQVGSTHLLVDEAARVLPPIGGAVDGVPDLDARVLLALVQLLLAQNVRLHDVVRRGA